MCDGVKRDRADIRPSKGPAAPLLCVGGTDVRGCAPPPSQVLQEMARVRNVVDGSGDFENGPMPNECNYYVVCDGATHDYERVGGPWRAKQINADEFESKVAQQTPVVDAAKHPEAFLLLNTDAALRSRREAVRAAASGNRFWLYTRTPPPVARAFGEVKDSLLFPSRVNHLAKTGTETWGPHVVEREVAQSILTKSFYAQSGFVDLLAEVKLRLSDEVMRGRCVSELRRLILGQGSVIMPDLVMTVPSAAASDAEEEESDDDDDDDDDDDPAEAPFVVLATGDVYKAVTRQSLHEIVRRSTDAVVAPSQETLEARAADKRLVDVGYALASFGAPDGSSWCIGGAPDANRGYTFVEAVHGDFETQSTWRTACVLMSPPDENDDDGDESAQEQPPRPAPRAVLERLVAQNRRNYDLNALGVVNPHARRLDALRTAEAMGLTDVETVTGRKTATRDGAGVEVAVTKAVVSRLESYLAWKKGSKASVRLCPPCGSMVRSDESGDGKVVCTDCAKNVMPALTAAIRDVFGVSVTCLRGVVNIEPPEHWPRCGPTRTHHLDFQTFMAEVHEHKESANDHRNKGWEQAQAASLKKYAESLMPMNGIQLKAEYAAIATRVLGSAPSANISSPELVERCMRLCARELRIDM